MKFKTGDKVKIISKSIGKNKSEKYKSRHFTNMIGTIAEYRTDGFGHGYSSPYYWAVRNDNGFRYHFLTKDLSFADGIQRFESKDFEI